MGKYIIIGDGVAGATAAETLRGQGEEGEEITVITNEKEPLYNRIMLKNYMKSQLPVQYTRVHDENWYEKRNIELNLETKVVEIDKESQEIQTSSGEKFSYDKILIASGGSPRKLSFDENYSNVHYMWTMEDAEKIRNATEESQKSVVIGGGLLGIDLAVAYAENGSDVDYLIREENWWSRGLDQEGAEIIHRKLEQKGVDVVTETEVEDFEAENGEVSGVITDSGRSIECDSVAVAIGQNPNSSFVDVEKNDSGMIKTGRFLETSDSSIYAAGNQVEYYSPVFEKRTVNGSWDHSEAMGETAALNMLDKQKEFDYVNTYGVGHFNVQFLAIGDWTGETVSKRYSDREYRRLFFDGDRLVGAVLIGKVKDQERLKSFIQEKKLVEDKESLL